jgi:hypothetical protein
VAGAGGEAVGWLRCAGYPRANIVRLYPKEWRKELGFVIPRGDDPKPHAIKHALGMTGRRCGEHESEALCIAQVVWAMYARRYESPLWRAR